MLPLIKVKPCANHVSDGFRVIYAVGGIQCVNFLALCRRTFVKKRALT